MRRIVAIASASLAGLVALSFVPPGSASAGQPVTLSSAAHVSVDVRVALRAYAALVEQRLRTTLTALAAVATSSDAASGRWDRMRAPLAATAHRLATAAATWYVQPSGSYFTTEEGLTHKSLSDRSYFPALMAGRDIEAPLVVSKSTGKWSAVVAAPIRADGKVVGGLGASIDLVKLTKTVGRSLSLPSDMTFFAIDSHGRYALNRDVSRIDALPSSLGSPSLKKAVHEMLSSTRGVVSYRVDGAEQTVAFTRSRATGWTFALGVVRG